MSCQTCGTDATHSDRMGCCAGCGTLFSGLQAFDRHFHRREDGSPVCVDPAHAETASGRQLFEQISVKGGVAWRLVSTGPNPWGES